MEALSQWLIIYMKLLINISKVFRTWLQYVCRLFKNVWQKNKPWVLSGGRGVGAARERFCYFLIAEKGLKAVCSLLLLQHFWFLKC